MTLRVMTASIELSGKVLRLCGPAMAHEPSGALHSARHIQRCGRFAAGSFQSIKLLCTQRVSPTCRILDTIGVGQYGPRGFEGGEPGNLHDADVDQCPTTREARSPKYHLMKLPSPRGSSVSANGSKIRT